MVKILIFGLLSKNANDEYTLEDETDHIELNLSQAFKSQGLFYCPGMFLLVEGIYSASGVIPTRIMVISEDVFMLVISGTHQVNEERQA